MGAIHLRGESVTDKKTDAWMPLWIGAYLADTMKLSTIQHGAYLLLLMAYWRERAPLPDDDEELRAITKTERAEWKRMRPTIARFFKVDAGVWWHKRVEAEILAADKRKAGAVSKAKAAAEARWGQANADAPSIPQAMPEECPTPSPIPLPSGERASEAIASAAAAAQVDAVEAVFTLGLPLLLSANVPEKNARSFLGRLRRFNTDAAIVQAIERCAKANALQPVEFLQGCLRVSKHFNRQEAQEQDGKRVAAEWLQEQAA